MKACARSSQGRPYLRNVCEKGSFCYTSWVELPGRDLEIKKPSYEGFHHQSALKNGPFSSTTNYLVSAGASVGAASVGATSAG